VYILKCLSRTIEDKIIIIKDTKLSKEKTEKLPKSIKYISVDTSEPGYYYLGASYKDFTLLKTHGKLCFPG